MVADYFLMSFSPLALLIHCVIHFRSIQPQLVFLRHFAVVHLTYLEPVLEVLVWLGGRGKSRWLCWVRFLVSQSSPLSLSLNFSLAVCIILWSVSHLSWVG